MAQSDHSKKIVVRARRAACWIALALSIASLGLRVRSMDGWRDHGLFYYAPRLFLSGRDPYDWDAMKAQWRADGRPLGIDPGATMSGYVTPPAMALLTLPPALAPPVLGYRSMDAWNLAALALCVLALVYMVPGRWPLEVRLLFAAFVLTLPDVYGVLLLGQTTLLICACLAASFFLWRRPGAGAAAGVPLGLALAKFTISLPFLGLLLYRRRWRAAAAAVAVFLAANLLFAAPRGVSAVLSSFRAAIARENRPGTSYDPGNEDATYMPNTLVHGQRLLYLALGPRRRLVDAVNMLGTLAAISIMAYVLRPGRRRGETWEPLEIALVTLSSLLLFYHRTYDLACLMLVAYALVEEGMRGPEYRTPLLGIMTAVLLLATHSAALVYGVGGALPRAADLPRLLCWTNGLSLAILFALCAVRLERSRHAEGAGARALEGAGPGT